MVLPFDLTLFCLIIKKLFCLIIKRYVFSSFPISARIAMDKVRNRSKGFGFVTFSSFDEAQKALDDMNGKVKSSLIAAF